MLLALLCANTRMRQEEQYKDNENDAGVETKDTNKKKDKTEGTTSINVSECYFAHATWARWAHGHSAPSKEIETEIAMDKDQFPTTSINVSGCPVAG